MLDVLEAVFPSSSSPASAQYYLMLFELTLFVLPLVAPRAGPTLDSLHRLWFVQWALPATLCVLIMLFDSSVALMFSPGGPKVEQARHQRNFYLTLLNLVLMLATTTNFRLRHEHAVYEERLRAATALLQAAQAEREEEAAHERVALARIASDSRCEEALRQKDEHAAALAVQLQMVTGERDKLLLDLRAVQRKAPHQQTAGQMQSGSVAAQRPPSPKASRASPETTTRSTSDTDSDSGSDAGETVFGVFNVHTSRRSQRQLPQQLQLQPPPPPQPPQPQQPQQLQPSPPPQQQQQPQPQQQQQQQQPKGASSSSQARRPAHEAHPTRVAVEEAVPPTKASGAPAAHPPLGFELNGSAPTPQSFDDRQVGASHRKALTAKKPPPTHRPQAKTGAQSEGKAELAAALQRPPPLPHRAPPTTTTPATNAGLPTARDLGEQFSEHSSAATDTDT